VIVGIVSCCKIKRSEPAAARDLYTSPLFRLSRAFVERNCDDWRILSAQNGVVLPTQCLAPYNLTLHWMSAAGRRGWAADCRDHLRIRFPGAHFVALCGAEYLKALEGLDYEAPLTGLGLGKRLAWLQQALSLPEAL